MPTNVTRICRAIKSQADDGTPQIVYYQAGVGTGGMWSKFVGGSTGEGLSENVREGYGFLAHNYHPGDSIHLFGFSRGAYTARSICGLICRIGILTKRGMDDFYTVYNDYMNGKTRDDAYVKGLQARDEGSWVTPNVKVTTIGCWDTVGSLGIPTLPIPVIGSLISGTSASWYSFYDTGLSPNVLNAFHALALDEQRTPFTPTLWRKADDNTVTNLSQVWFPGVHTNVGGGYDDQEIADMTLAWMIYKTIPWIDFDTNGYIRRITKTGPDLSLEWAAGKIYNSRTGYMRLAGRDVRKPGEYYSVAETSESFHVSVRVRQQVVSPVWKCNALAGWTWIPADKAWMKGEVRIKEDWLGDLEMELAGRDIVESLLGWAFPTEAQKKSVQVRN